MRVHAYAFNFQHHIRLAGHHVLITCGTGPLPPALGFMYLAYVPELNQRAVVVDKLFQTVTAS